MRVRAVIVVTVTVALAAASGAHGNHALIEPASPGTAGSRAPTQSDPGLSAVSPEGRVFFTTRDSLVPADTDGLSDLYERSTGAPSLVSTGPSADGGQIVDLAQTELVFPRAGGRAFFTTPERLTPDDTDTAWDYYEWFNGVNRLVPILPGGCPGPDVKFNADGSRVFYQSTAQLVPEDTDTGCDIYLYADGQTILVTTGPGGGRFPDGGGDAISDDGSRVLFESSSAMLPEDQDARTDVYLWDEGAITLISTGPGDTHTGAIIHAAMSRDGERVIFDTQEPLLPEDTDAPGTIANPTTWYEVDVYERRGATLTLRSPGGPRDAWALLPVHGARAVSDDGSRVVFQSGGPGFTSDDTDSSDDLYENVGGVTRLVSTAPTVACPTNTYRCGVEFHRMNPDGTHILWTTEEQLTAGDTDGCNDAYERTNGETKLVTVGGRVCRFYRVTHISDDGERIFFEHDASLAPDDLDGVSCTMEGSDGETLRAPCLDVYERYAGQTTLLSIGPNGGSGGSDARFRGASDDGTVVAFDTDEPLFLSDTNNVHDAFIRRVATGYPRPKAATPLRVSLVPAMLACSTPNRTHGPPLEHPACSPPAASSTLLTAGFGDGHPAPARSVGYARLAAIVGPPGGPDDSDMRLQTRITNVMLASDLSDYTGELRGQVTLRITDRDNGGEQGTVTDVPFGYTIPCTATATTAGAVCDLQSTAEAFVPGMVAEGERAIFALGQIRIFDGGPDHDGDTEGDNSPFAVQGIFVP